MIIQTDRDTAYEIWLAMYPILPKQARLIRSGDLDNNPIVKIIAAYRERLEA